MKTNHYLKLLAFFLFIQLSSITKLWGNEKIITKNEICFKFINTFYRNENLSKPQTPPAVIKIKTQFYMPDHRLRWLKSVYYENASFLIDHHFYRGFETNERMMLKLRAFQLKKEIEQHLSQNVLMGESELEFSLFEFNLIVHHLYDASEAGISQLKDIIRLGNKNTATTSDIFYEQVIKGEGGLPAQAFQFNQAFLSPALYIRLMLKEYKNLRHHIHLSSTAWGFLTSSHLLLDGIISIQLKRGYQRLDGEGQQIFDSLSNAAHDIAHTLYASKVKTLFPNLTIAKMHIWNSSLVQGNSELYGFILFFLLHETISAPNLIEVIEYDLPYYLERSKLAIIQHFVDKLGYDPKKPQLILDDAKKFLLLGISHLASTNELY